MHWDGVAFIFTETSFVVGYGLNVHPCFGHNLSFHDAGGAIVCPLSKRKKKKRKSILEKLEFGVVGDGWLQEAASIASLHDKIKIHFSVHLYESSTSSGDFDLQL